MIAPPQRMEPIMRNPRKFKQLARHLKIGCGNNPAVDGVNACVAQQRNPRDRIEHPVIEVAMSHSADECGTPA